MRELPCASCGLTFWLRHAGPTSRVKQESATPRCLEPMVRLSVLLCAHGLYELGPVIDANGAHHLSDVVIYFLALFRIVLSKRGV